jgi:hypothetical protein
VKRYHVQAACKRCGHSLRRPEEIGSQLLKRVDAANVDAAREERGDAARGAFYLVGALDEIIRCAASELGGVCSTCRALEERNA